jgi:hypothetical protein
MKRLWNLPSFQQSIYRGQYVIQLHVWPSPEGARFTTVIFEKIGQRLLRHFTGSDENEFIRLARVWCEKELVLLLTPRRVRQLTAEGVFTRAHDPETGEFLRSRYSLVETTHAYIKFLREGKLDDPDESNYVRSRSRRMYALAESEELRLKVLKGALHRAEDVEYFMSNRERDPRPDLGDLVTDCPEIALIDDSALSKSESRRLWLERFPRSRRRSLR